MKLYQLYCNFYKTPVDYLHNSLSPDMRNELYYQYYLFSHTFTGRSTAVNHRTCPM